jgi:hypothetical protein
MSTARVLENKCQFLFSTSCTANSTDHKDRKVVDMGRMDRKLEDKDRMVRTGRMDRKRVRNPYPVAGMELEGILVYSTSWFQPVHT